MKLRKVENYLAQDPINRGKLLTGQYKGYYRCRFSNCQVIYQVQEKELVILVVKVRTLERDLLIRT